MKRNIVVLLLILSACGAPNPFHRGDKVGEGLSDVVTTSGNEDGGDALSENFFQQSVLPILNRKCMFCHSNPAPDFAAAEKMVVFKKPNLSDLVLYATGKKNSHRPILKDGSVEIGVIISWINGATGEEPPTTTVTTTTTTSTTTTNTSSTTTSTSTTTTSSTTTTLPANSSGELNQNYFNKKLYPILDVKCSFCHENPGSSFENAKSLVVFRNPQASDLYNYSIGAKDGHKVVLKPGSAELQTLTDWINGASIDN